MNWLSTTAIMVAVIVGFAFCMAMDLRSAESYRLQIDGPQGYKVQLEKLGRVVEAANTR